MSARKKCARCGKRRAISRFNVDRSRMDGRHPYCTMGGACVDCRLAPSSTWPVACFDFHHVNASEKNASVARLLAHGKPAKILAELRKCVVLCANCHRRRHAKKEH